MKESNTKQSNDLIEACFLCVTVCERCITDAIYINNKRCIELCRDCADICTLTARFEGRNSDYLQTTLELCATICEDCSNECMSMQNDNNDCKECADACNICLLHCSFIKRPKPATA